MTVRAYVLIQTEVGKAAAVAAEIGVLEGIVTADDVTRPKPATDLYALACERLGVEPSAAVAFEDSTVGVRSAKAAGST